MTKILVPVAIAFVVGFFSHNFFIPNRAPEETPIDAKCEDLAQAKSNLVALSQSEYLEYTKIKDLKEKYEKADELLGKVMLLFLADVGFKTLKTEPLDYSISTPKTETTPSPEPPAEASPQEIVGLKTPANIPGRGAQIRNVNDEKRTQAILTNSIIEDPKVSLAQGSSLNRRQIRLLEGRYLGSVKLFDRKRGDLSVVWELTPDPTKNRLTGTFSLSIHGTDVNSDSNSSGTIDTIASLAEDRDGFLVRACGTRCYLQLYYNSRSDQFYGNYYEVSEKTGKSMRAGTVELRK